MHLLMCKARNSIQKHQGQNWKVTLYINVKKIKWKMQKAEGHIIVKIALYLSKQVNILSTQTNLEICFYEWILAHSIGLLNYHITCTSEQYFCHWILIVKFSCLF